MNRIGDTVVFQSLSARHLLEIVELQLSRVRGLLSHRGLVLELTPTAQQYGFEVGFDPGLGARPLQRAVSEPVQDPLAEALLACGPRAGDVARLDTAPGGGGLSLEVGSGVSAQFRPSRRG